MKNPIIVKIDNKDEILLSDEDVMSLIREKLGDEVAAAVQEIIDDLKYEADGTNSDLHSYEAQVEIMNDAAHDIKYEADELLCYIEFKERLKRSELLKSLREIKRILDNNFNV